MTLGKVDIPTRGMVPIPIEGNVQYGELNIEFIVDEDLRNYMELHNWIRALGVPQGDDEAEIFKIANRNPRIPTGQYKGFNDYRYSDATLQVLNNNNLVNF